MSTEEDRQALALVLQTATTPADLDSKAYWLAEADHVLSSHWWRAHEADVDRLRETLVVRERALKGKLTVAEARLAAVEAVLADCFTGPINGQVMEWVPADELRAALSSADPAPRGTVTTRTCTPDCEECKIARARAEDADHE